MCGALQEFRVYRGVPLLDMHGRASYAAGIRPSTRNSATTGMMWRGTVAGEICVVADVGSSSLWAGLQAVWTLWWVLMGGHCCKSPSLPKCGSSFCLRRSALCRPSTQRLWRRSCTSAMRRSPVARVRGCSTPTRSCTTMRRLWVLRRCHSLTTDHPLPRQTGDG